jgi:uncharacterized protein (UPF0276 family)
VSSAILGVSAAKGEMFESFTKNLKAKALAVDCLEINPENSCDFLGKDSCQNKTLLAHSVQFSLFDPDFDLRAWIAKTKQNLGGIRPNFFTVHFGVNYFDQQKLWTFLPANSDHLQIRLAADRLKILSDAFACPVGVENLAIALSTNDTLRQIESIKKILALADAYLLLDLHNLHCQSINFNLDLASLLSHYPLERIKEMHISGGSDFWTKRDQRYFRRDTHDGPVPLAIKNFLPHALNMAPNTKWVIHEVWPEYDSQRLLDSVNDHLEITESMKRSDSFTMRRPNPQTVSFTTYDIDLNQLYSDLYRFVNLENLCKKYPDIDPRSLEVCQVLIRKWLKPAARTSTRVIKDLTP